MEKNPQFLQQNFNSQVSGSIESVEMSVRKFEKERKELPKNVFDFKEEYMRTMAAFAPDVRAEKEQIITQALQQLRADFAKEKMSFTEQEYAVLKLKLARYLQRENTIDVNTLRDAILETPKFLKSDKGGLHRLFEIHEEKTLQKIAENRKRRAEMTGEVEYNPYESLFTTASGKYYLARLLNLPHLEEESEYMEHCVGTSDSYLNKIKRGDVEIFSLRTVPVFNEKKGRLEGDKPVVTIEYDPKDKKIIQLQKAGSEFITNDDLKDLDVFDIVEQISNTTTDTNIPRDFSRISTSELVNITVKDYSVLTKKGEVSFRDYRPEMHGAFLKAGKMPLEGLLKSEITKVVDMLSGIHVKPEEIAQQKNEITAETKMYIGPLDKDIFKTIPSTVEHVYSSFPEEKLSFDKGTIGGKDVQQLMVEIEKAAIQFPHAKKMMEQPEFSVQKDSEEIDLVRLSVRALGFFKRATTDAVYKKAEELGLELCPAEVGPHYRLAYTNQPIGEFINIAMKPISGRDGYPNVFGLLCDYDGLQLGNSRVIPNDRWSLDDQFIFRLRKQSTPETAHPPANSGQQ